MRENINLIKNLNTLFPEYELDTGESHSEVVCDIIVDV